MTSDARFGKFKFYRNLCRGPWFRARDGVWRRGFPRNGDWNVTELWKRTGLFSGEVLRTVRRGKNWSFAA